MAQTRYRKKDCYFCKEKSEPDYKDVALLRKFITEKGKIIPRTKTGMCAKHGRRSSKAIKRSRYMALLSFTTKVK